MSVPVGAVGRCDVCAAHAFPQGWNIRLFTAIATLGTPQEITVQELLIESFFPMDNATDKLFRIRTV